MGKLRAIRLSWFFFFWQVLKEEFKSHFRNISRIMDCVGCDKCRLWGKLQVTGLGTALKLLFSYEDDPSKYVFDSTALRAEGIPIKPLVRTAVPITLRS